jgi:uncharacterized protein YlxP (DUF503 family)
MFVAISRFEIFIPGGRSLKGKRSVVASIKERVRVRFHAAVSEVDHQELWQRAALGVALVGMRPTALAAGLSAIRRLVEENAHCQLISWNGRVSAFADLVGAEADALEQESEDGPQAEHPAEGDGPAWYETGEGDETFGKGWERFRRQAAESGEAGGEHAGDGAERGDDPDRRGG